MAQLASPMTVCKCQVVILSTKVALLTVMHPSMRKLHIELAGSSGSFQSKLTAIAIQTSLAILSSEECQQQEESRDYEASQQ